MKIRFIKSLVQMNKYMSGVDMYTKKIYKNTCRQSARQF